MTPRRGTLTWRGLWGPFFLVLLVALSAPRLAAAGEAPAGISDGKARRELKAPDSHTVSYAAGSFPLSDLGVEALAEDGEDPRLTFSVDQGGDVLWLDGDRAVITGWGDARIVIRADETVRFLAAERAVTVHVVKPPEIRVYSDEIGAHSARINLEVDRGSYSPGELYDWSFQFRETGKGEWSALPLNEPPVLPFYFMLNNLKQGTEYDVRVAAAVLDQITREEREIQNLYRLCTGGSGQGTLTWRLVNDTGLADAVTVSLWSGRTAYGEWKHATEGGSFSGLRDGLYQLVADNGVHRAAVPVEMAGGKAEPELRLAAFRSAVEFTPEAPDVFIWGMDKLAGDTGLPEGHLVEYGFSVWGADGDGDASVPPLAEDETVGMRFGLALVKSRYDRDGRRVESAAVTELPESLDLAVRLPDALREKKGIRLLRVGDGTAEEIPCTVRRGDGTLRFSTERLSGFAVVHTEPIPAVPAVQADLPDRSEERPAVFEEAPEKSGGPEGAEPAPFGPYLPAAFLTALAAAGILAICLICFRYKNERLRRRLRESEREVALLEEEVDALSEAAREDERPLEESCGAAAEEAEAESRENSARFTPPELEESFFLGIEARRALRRQFEKGEVSEEEFREREREILLRM